LIEVASQGGPGLRDEGRVNEKLHILNQEVPGANLPGNANLPKTLQRLLVKNTNKGGAAKSILFVGIR